MRKIKFIFMFVFFVFITGCSSYDMSMEIKGNKQVLYTITILSEDSLDKMINLYDKKYSKYGYSVESYEQNGKYGMMISKTFNNIDDISNGSLDVHYDLLYLYNKGYDSDVESKIFYVDKGILKNKYSANFIVDLSDLEIDFDNVNVSYSVTLPKSALSSNSNSVSYDGKKLNWSISSADNTKIQYEFELYNYDYLYMVIAVLIVICLVFFIIKNLFFNNKDKGKLVNLYSGIEENDDMNFNTDFSTNDVVNTEVISDGINNGNNYNSVSSYNNNISNTMNGSVMNNNISNSINNSFNNMNNNTINNSSNADLFSVKPVLSSEQVSNNIVDTSVENNLYTTNLTNNNVNSSDGSMIRLNDQSVMLDNNIKEDI